MPDRHLCVLIGQSENWPNFHMLPNGKCFYFLLKEHFCSLTLKYKGGHLHYTSLLKAQHSCSSQDFYLFRLTSISMAAA